MKINFIAIFKALGVKAFAGLAGWQAWLIDMILNKVWKALIKAWNKALISIQEKKEVKDELKKYDEALHKKDATADDIKKSAPDFLG